MEENLLRHRQVTWEQRQKLRKSGNGAESPHITKLILSKLR